MKLFKIIISLFLSLGLNLPLMGQTVDSTRIKKGTNGGLAGDASNALWVATYIGTSAPSSPVTGAIWCDSNYSPCQFKIYNGSTWNLAVTVGAFTTQSGHATFPGSPVAGQCFIDTATYPGHLLICYDGTNWNRMDTGGTLTASLTDTYGATVIANPTAAITAAANGSGGSMTAGTHYFKVSCYDANGSSTLISTTPSSFSSAFATNDKANLSNVPTCTSATGRYIWMTKANIANTGQYYLAGSIADNSTTTANITLGDGSLQQFAPTKNFTGAISNWVVTNTTGSATGGCGSTGTSLVCMGGIGGPVRADSTSTDPVIRAAIDISSYTGGDFTIQYRVVYLGTDGTTNSTGRWNFGGLRVGTADGGIRVWMHALGGNNISATVALAPDFDLRSTISGTSTTTIGTVPIPVVTSYPFWVRISKRSGASATVWNAWISKSGVVWTPIKTTTTGGAQATVEAAGAWQPSSAYTRFEFAPVETAVATGGSYWIEVDSFTITSE